MKSLKHPCAQTSPDCVDVSEEETNHCQTSIASCKNIVLADLTERGLVQWHCPAKSAQSIHHATPFTKETTLYFVQGFSVLRPAGRTDSDKLQMHPWASAAPATSYFAGLC